MYGRLYGESDDNLTIHWHFRHAHVHSPTKNIQKEAFLGHTALQNERSSLTNNQEFKCKPFSEDMAEDGATTLVGSLEIWKPSAHQPSSGWGHGAHCKVGNPHVLHDQGEGSMKLL